MPYGKLAGRLTTVLDPAVLELLQQRSKPPISLRPCENLEEDLHKLWGESHKTSQIAKWDITLY